MVVQAGMIGAHLLVIGMVSEGFLNEGILHAPGADHHKTAHCQSVTLSTWHVPFHTSAAAPWSQHDDAMICLEPFRS